MLKILDGLKEVPPGWDKTRPTGQDYLCTYHDPTGSLRALFDEINRAKEEGTFDRMLNELRVSVK